MLLPRRIEWKNRNFSYEQGRVTLYNHHLKITEKFGSKEKIVFRTRQDWNVQDVLCFDINQDGKEELIMLVWKHGSYGKHLPIWVKHNDIRLEQHIFIYQWEESRQSRIRPVWMSSAIGYEVSSIEQGEEQRLLVTDRRGERKVWEWKDFGLKLFGKWKEHTGNPSVRFVCAGDNLIHLNLLYGKDGNYDCFYDEVREKVSQADLATVNQETVFVKERGRVSDYPRFGTPIEVGDALVKAGFDIVTLANNHALDKDAYGIDVTKEFYRGQKGVTCIGAHSSEEAADTPEESVSIVEKNGIRFALLNYTYGTNGRRPPDGYPNMVESFSKEDRIKEQIAYAKEQSDAILVFAHWGTEYSEKVDEEQKRITTFLRKQGVDVIIGTHPHVLQPYETLSSDDGHSTLVYYSLGNLISAQDKPECQIGGLAEFTIEKTEDGAITIKDAKLTKIRAVRKK